MEKTDGLQIMNLCFPTCTSCMATCMGIIATHLPMIFHFFMYGHNERQISNKTKTIANKVLHSFVKGKLWILVYIEHSKMTFCFVPKIKENAFLRALITFRWQVQTFYKLFTVCIVQAKHFLSLEIHCTDTYLKDS